MRKSAIIIILLIALTGTCACSDKTPTYTYKIINTFPHDKDAFAQGLVFADGYLFEGTGIYGESSLRKVQLETGEVVQIHRLSNRLFGEGITIFKDRIIQLTWLSGRGLVYDKRTFKTLREFRYPTQGWGITHNGKHLIMSDGSATLYFLDPTTFNKTGHITVDDKRCPVKNLNELEYIHGEIYANVWKKNVIARISPRTGTVIGWIDLSELCTWNGVLNGIAYDAENDRLFVTGKLWPYIYEIKVIAK